LSFLDLGKPGQRAFSSVARSGFRMLFRGVCNIRVEHLDPIPPNGPLILAVNHISHFDPPLVGSLFPRAVDWMAMDELFQNGLFARALELTAAFRVQRDGSDRTALRTAARRLHAGRVVGIFPEGGIRAGASSILEGAPMRPGVGALAMLGRAPILPCVVIGTDRLYKKDNWLRRPPVWVLTGRIIDPFEENGELTRQEIHRRLAAAFRLLRTEAILRFGLTEGDLPTTPQARKGQDPFAPL
jgi:1-acyl-sn-glycerol-3-phosphate acyltransferase